ncbi:MAG: sulfite dehydrogenase [Caulobacteraceae bacterium]|nr:sulfite dehydrogenase [Caulobacteraceae bacterium]
MVPRRGVLKGAAALAAGTTATGRAVSQSRSNLPPNIPEWMKTQGATILSPPYGLPSPFEKNVIRRQRTRTPTQTAATTTTPLQDLQGIITPNGLHFERDHGGVPAIDPDQHRLMVHGLVERPLIFTMDDLTRFPSVSRLYFIECSGNGSWNVLPPATTAQESRGLLSCAEWTGVPLATVLAEAGVKPGAAWLLAEGADAAAMTRSVPIAKAMDDALLCYSQNGERLRPEQGYPLRLLLPGFEGNMSVKWLRRLKLGDQPFQTREETGQYSDLMPNGVARQFTFVMEANSIITFPSGGQRLHGPGSYEISGLAWSGRGRVTGVEVSTDGGRQWRRAALQEPVLTKCLTRFRLPWTWDGAPALLLSRSIDETGYIQPSRAKLVAVRGLNSHYHYNAIQPWQVAADGTVTYVA